ncbi:MAG: glycosyltransferase [Clostridia bacterium]|nr:glycosyltransferase [Clostridia bacterium]
MKVLQINGIFPIKSTGRIVKQLADIQKENGIEAYIACGESTVQADNVYVIGSKVYNKLNILMTRLFGKHGFYNKIATRKFLEWVDVVKPDIIHLHNIHGHYLNIKILFEYIKKHNIPVVWTLHDCWAFTGHCAYFDIANCEKWKTGCRCCPLKRKYPVSWFFDRSKGNFRDKKRAFTNVSKMHIVTPSYWLKGLCEKSFLGSYPVHTLHNGIDTDVFLPTDSDIKRKLGIDNKFVILGIISNFESHKGGKAFLELSEMISDDEVIVLLSLEEKPDKIPFNIIPLARTNDDKRLAEIYSMADVFVNPTLQDNFPTVNIESLACGTPVITYNSGGSGESQCKGSGYVVRKGDVKGLYDAIKKLREKAIPGEQCRAQALNFKAHDCFEKYFDIYERLR